MRAAALALLVVAAPCTAGGCADLARGRSDAPTAHGGVVDLSRWDFDVDGPIALDGTWDFLWGALASPARGDDDFDLARRAPSAQLHVPGQWSDGGFPGTGFGTYRLLVKLPPHAPPLALARSHADSAYALFVDDGSARRRVLGSGVPAASAGDEVPECRFAVGDLPRANELVLLSSVSNFHYPRGGEGAHLLLGRRQDLERLRDAARARDFFLAGFILVVGLYHLVLFALRRSERAPLWFGLFCVLMAVRALERGRHLEDLFPSLHLFAATKRIEYLGFYLAVPLFAAYLDALLEASTNRFARRAFTALFVALGAVVVVTPPLWFGHTADAAQLAALAAIAWMLVELVLALVRRRDKTLFVVLFGFVALGATVVLDMVSNLGVLQLPVLTPVGQAVFVVAQAAVIATQNARARRTAEELTRETLRLSKLKDEFLANTSHELRTPLNAIINIPHGLLEQIEERTVIACAACGALYDDNDDDLDGAACPGCGEAALSRTVRRFVPDDADALAAHLRAIIGSGEHLLSVVNDILDSSKLAAGQLELTLERLDAGDVVERALGVLRPLARSAGVELVTRVEPGLAVRGDRTRLVQVLTNLLANAVKHAPAGSAVDVEAAAADERAVFRVIDRGPGIAAEHHALIFESFRQVDAGHTRKHGGTGLGLAICKKLVELHGGTIDVDSALGRGATFTVKLPRG